METHVVVYILLVISSVLLCGGIIYGFKLMNLVRFNRLWTIAWIFFILMLAAVLVRRFMSYVFHIDGFIEQIIVLVASFSFFSFGHLIYRFFKKYLNGIK